MSEGIERLARNLWRSDSAEATERLGELLAPILEEGDVVILEGDLGAGKTQFVKGVARGLGADGEVTSPTFNLLSSHEGGRLALHHMDLYRLADEGELGEAGALDMVGIDGAALVEWGEPFADALAPARLELTIVRDDATAGIPDREPSRRIAIRGVGERGEEMARALDRLGYR